MVFWGFLCRCIYLQKALAFDVGSSVAGGGIQRFKSKIFRDVMPCSLVDGHQASGGIC